MSNPQLKRQSECLRKNNTRFYNAFIVTKLLFPHNYNFHRRFLQCQHLKIGRIRRRQTQLQQLLRAEPRAQNSLRKHCRTHGRHAQMARRKESDRGKLEKKFAAIRHRLPNSPENYQTLTPPIEPGANHAVSVRRVFRSTWLLLRSN